MPRPMPEPPPDDGSFAALHPTATAEMPIFKGREGRLINYYVETEDLSRAATMAGLDIESAARPARIHRHSRRV